MKNFKLSLSFAALLLSAALLAPPASAQVALRSTTFASAVAQSDNVVVVASASGIEVGDIAYEAREAMRVLAINGTALTVSRGYEGIVSAHASGATVYVDDKTYFDSKDRAGACTSALEVVLPVVNMANGRIFDCQNGVWGQVADYVYWLSADNCEFLPETLTTTNTRVRLGSAGVPVLNGVSNAAAGTEHLVCTILPPTRATPGKGAIVKDIVVYVGSQTVAPTSIGTPTLGTITFATPATGALANTVTPVTIGGTVTKVTATAVTTVTTAGAFVPIKMTFSTIVDLGLDFTVLVLDFPLVQSAASAMTVNTPGFFVHYRAPVAL